MKYLTFMSILGLSVSSMIFAQDLEAPKAFSTNIKVHNKTKDHIMIQFVARSERSSAHNCISDRVSFVDGDIWKGIPMTPNKEMLLQIDAKNSGMCFFNHSHQWFRVVGDNKAEFRFQHLSPKDANKGEILYAGKGDKYLINIAGKKVTIENR